MTTEARRNTERLVRAATKMNVHMRSAGLGSRDQGAGVTKLVSSASALAHSYQWKFAQTTKLCTVSSTEGFLSSIFDILNRINLQQAFRIVFLGHVPVYVCVFTFFLCSGCGSTSEEESASTGKPQATEPEWVADEVEETGKDPFAPQEVVSPPPLQVEAPPQKIYRPDDTRTIPNVEDLAEFGIYKYESKRLILYTDVDPQVAATLPEVVDQAFDALVAYFGELPPARSGADFQMTGYLIGDRDLILSAGLLPPDLSRFDHGQHRGQEFWMYEQKQDYYRRHLLVHEVTHCFMMLMPGIRPPLWYLEGMAEFFATHRIDEDGNIEFGVMPEASANYRGFGRIEILHAEVAAGRILNIDSASRLGVNEFANSRSVPYAWSWALCKFLDTHPRYQERFRQLSNHLVGKEFQRLADSLFVEDKILLSAEWDQFIRRCEYDWDFRANAFVVDEQKPSEITRSATMDILANQGWQSSGYLVSKGKEYSISAIGQVTLDVSTKPWISEPQGVSIEYVNHLPIGRLEVGVLVEPQDNGELIEEVFEVQDCGRGAILQFENSGLLMFQVNDFASKRLGNRGEYEVSVELK